MCGIAVDFDAQDFPELRRNLHVGTGYIADFPKGFDTFRNIAVHFPAHSGRFQLIQGHLPVSRGQHFVRFRADHFRRHGHVFFVGLADGVDIGIGPLFHGAAGVS